MAVSQEETPHKRRNSKAELRIAKTVEARADVTAWLAKHGHHAPAGDDKVFASWAWKIVTGFAATVPSPSRARAYIRQMAAQMRQSDRGDDQAEADVQKRRRDAIAEKRAKAKHKRKPMPKYLRKKGARAWLSANERRARSVVGRIMREQ